MVFPLPCLKTQLAAMYNRPGFKENLRKWTNRDVVTGIISDIYDGNIRKEFPSCMELWMPQILPNSLLLKRLNPTWEL